MDIDAQDAFDIRFFEAYIRRSPRDADTLELLGGLYSKYGMAKQSLRIDRRLTRLLPRDARARYNLACSLSLLGRKREAVDHLRNALELGYEDIGWILQDPDLAPLRGFPHYEGLLASLSSG